MKLIIQETYEELSQLTAEIVTSTMVQDKRVNVSITSGSSPKRMYELLEDKLPKLGDLSNVYYYTFDETPVKNSKGEVIGYDNFDGLNNNFFKKHQIDEKHIIAINETNYDVFNKIIETDGGLDLMVIGMGEDGHFCANMPECTEYDKEVYAIDLNKVECDWNTEYKESLGENYSDYMYTLGLPSLMKVSHVVLIINGEHKAKATKKALTGPLDPQFPSSFLRLLPNLTVILDSEAAKFL